MSNLIDSGTVANVATPEYIEQVAKAISEGMEDVEPHKVGITALLVAAQAGHYGAVKMLAEAGADVTVIDVEDVTPLLAAIKGNYGKVATYLVEHGANPNDIFIDEKVLPLIFYYSMLCIILILIRQSNILIFTPFYGRILTCLA